MHWKPSCCRDLRRKNLRQYIDEARDQLLKLEVFKMYAGLSILKFDSLFEVSNNKSHQRSQSEVSQTSLSTGPEEVLLCRTSHRQMEFS